MSGEPLSRHVVVRMDDEMLDRLRTRAKAEDRSVAWLVRKALSAYLCPEHRPKEGNQ